MVALGSWPADCQFLNPVLRDKGTVPVHVFCCRYFGPVSLRLESRPHGMILKLLEAPTRWATQQRPPRLTPCSHLPTFFGDICRRHFLSATFVADVGGWTWLTSVTFAVIGRLTRLSKTHSTTRCRWQIYPTIVFVGNRCCRRFYGIGNRCRRHLSASVNMTVILASVRMFQSTAGVGRCCQRRPSDVARVGVTAASAAWRTGRQLHPTGERWAWRV